MKLLLLGPPCVGKGSVSRKLLKKFDIIHVGSGELLRAAYHLGYEYGKKAKEYVDKGELVPDEVMNGLMKERLSKDDCQKGFILDGYPRTPEQAKALEEMGIKLDKVINLVVDPEILANRILGRRSCKNCGEIYNLVTMPPEKEGTCDKCGSALMKRDDDVPDVIRHRCEVYKDKTARLNQYYRDIGLLIDVDADAMLDEVCERCIEAVK